MSYALGLSLILKLCEEQSAMAWHRAKLAPEFFKPYEQEAFVFVEEHLKKFHVLPHPQTLGDQFPDIGQLQVVEPAKFYLEKIESRWMYERINKANLDSQTVLSKNENASEDAVNVLRSAIQEITLHKSRLRIIDVGLDGPSQLIQHYHLASLAEELAVLGWSYVDGQGRVEPGDVISFVGRPAAGKTWKMIWSAASNWQRGHNVLVASMEMKALPILQRLSSIYTHLPIGQLKTSTFSSQSWKKFYESVKGMQNEQAKMYVVDGNLAATVDDIFNLAQMLKCNVIYIDGAYLLRHPNKRLDRYTRAAENVEWIKQMCGDTDSVAFCSWQFNREASKKQKKSADGNKDTGLEDIGYSDAIGQISSIVMGLFQEDSIETMKERQIRVLKGRNGEVGQFSIAWDFQGMSFEQTDPPLAGKADHSTEELQWI